MVDHFKTHLHLDEAYTYYVWLMYQQHDHNSNRLNVLQDDIIVQVVFHSQYRLLQMILMDLLMKLIYEVVVMHHVVRNVK